MVRSNPIHLMDMEPPQDVVFTLSVYIFSQGGVKVKVNPSGTRI